MKNKNTSDLPTEKRAETAAESPADSVDAALERSRKLNDELEALVNELREVAQQRGLPV